MNFHGRDGNIDLVWQDLLIYCANFNIPINSIVDILRDPKVSPMIRGKAFEYSVLQQLAGLLKGTQWSASKPRTNPQSDDHDRDLVLSHVITGQEFNVECKMAKKGSLKLEDDDGFRWRVKCMRSRTLGEREIIRRAPMWGMSVPMVKAHSDSYLDSQFDFVVSSLSNSLYDTVDDEYVWTPTADLETRLCNVLDTEPQALQKRSHEFLFFAPAQMLSPRNSGVECRRRNCLTPTTCPFIPNNPWVASDINFQLHEPWRPISRLPDFLSGDV